MSLPALAPPAIYSTDNSWASQEQAPRPRTREQVMLPIWHNVSKDEVIKFSPSLADKVARSTSTHTINEIANEIAELILDDLHDPAA